VKTINRSGDEIERMVTKESGFFYEYRGFQANGYFYTLIFGKKAKSAVDLNANTALLDSFKPVYQASNKSLKDLARIIDGKITYTDEEYGLSIKLPKEWVRDTEESKPYFTGPDESYLELNISSFEEGDTVEKWVDRAMLMYTDLIKETYRKETVKSSIVWNGVPAILVENSTTIDMKTWTTGYEIYAFSGTHKYNLTLSYDDKNIEDVSDIKDQLLNGMKLDFAKIEKELGEIPDPDDIDYKILTTKTSKENGYSITLPKSWTKGNVDMDGDLVEFNAIIIMTLDLTGLDVFIEQFKAQISNSGQFRVDSSAKVTYAGVSAWKLEMTATELYEIPAKATIYLFEKNGKIFMVQGVVLDATSELIAKQVQDALSSFQFTDK
jgi:hypothetical protein